MTDENRILIAEIGAAHGIRGLVKLRVYCEDLGLLNGDIYTHETGDQTLSIKIERETATAILARVGDITDRTAAEKLRGIKLYIARDTLPEIDEDGTFYYSDLEDLDVYDAAGTRIGTVISVQNFGASDLIEVKPITGTSFYVPFDDEFVPGVDLEAGRVTIANYAEFLPEPGAKKKQS